MITLDDLKDRRAALVRQREQARVVAEQAHGAIAVLDDIIRAEEAASLNAPLSPDRMPLSAETTASI